MLYYLLQNSSWIKKKPSKDRLLYTLVGGSLVYLVLHALISYSLKPDIIKYLWFLFFIDIVAVAISTDVSGLTTSLQNNSFYDSNDNKNLNSNPNLEIIDSLNQDITQKNTQYNASNLNTRPKLEKPAKEVNSRKKKILKNNSKNNSKVGEKKKKKKTGKSVTFEESTPINTITEQLDSDEETYNSEEANNINLTLESLESLDNLNIGIEPNFPTTKKMEDEYSDIGSELDLAKFENAIANSS